MVYKIAGYTLKIWLTALVIAPLALVFTKFPVQSSYQVAFMLSVIFSFPSLLVLFLCCWLFRKAANVVRVKISLSVIGVVLTYAPFLYLNDFNPSINNDNVSLPLF